MDNSISGFQIITPDSDEARKIIKQMFKEEFKRYEAASQENLELKTKLCKVYKENNELKHKFCEKKKEARNWKEKCDKKENQLVSKLKDFQALATTSKDYQDLTEVFQSQLKSNLQKLQQEKRQWIVKESQFKDREKELSDQVDALVQETQRQSQELEEIIPKAEQLQCQLWKVKAQLAQQIHLNTSLTQEKEEIQRKSQQDVRMVEENVEQLREQLESVEEVHQTEMEMEREIHRVDRVARIRKIGALKNQIRELSEQEEKVKVFLEKLAIISSFEVTNGRDLLLQPNGLENLIGYVETKMAEGVRINDEALGHLQGFLNNIPIVIAPVPDVATASVLNSEEEPPSAHDTEPSTDSSPPNLPMDTFDQDLPPLTPGAPTTSIMGDINISQIEICKTEMESSRPQNSPYIMPLEEDNAMALNDFIYDNISEYPAPSAATVAATPHMLGSRAPVEICNSNENTDSGISSATPGRTMHGNLKLEHCKKTKICLCGRIFGSMHGLRVHIGKLNKSQNGSQGVFGTKRKISRAKKTILYQHRRRGNKTPSYAEILSEALSPSPSRSCRNTYANFVGGSVNKN